jgi:CelD/BcsL family acetyltransferase involved in cellulose biosynthesis
MDVRTIESTDELSALRDEWNALLNSSPSNCVFLTHEWMSAWWKHLGKGRRLSVLTAREGGDLIGILPLAERRPQYDRMMPRTLEFLGSGVIGSDYLDAIVAPAREFDVAAAFAERLDGRAVMLHLSNMRGGSSVAPGIAQQLRQKRWTAEEKKLNVCPFIDLTGKTWPDYLEGLGPHVRKGIKRCLRNLPKTFRYRVECVQAPEDAQRGLEIAIDLHRKRWTGARKSEAFQTDSAIAFHREFAQLAAGRGWLRLLIVYLDDVPAAALYGLCYGSTFYFYQSGFDPAYSKHSVGVAVMALAVETAIREGMREYDFLHGDEEYKFHWAHQSRDLIRLEVHPPQVSAWVYKHAIGFNRMARQMARRMLTRASHVAVTR